LRWWRGFLRRAPASDTSLRETLEEVFEEHDDTRRALTAEERHMLGCILSFGELRVDAVMVPRADVIGVEESATLEEVLKLYRDSAHSRMPIYRETLDDPVGMVHIKDVMGYLAPRNAEAERQAEPFSLKSIRRNILFVPPSMPALDLLVKMQATRIHLALVIDEYGGTDGLVSIEDLVEEIVGDINDEHDDAIAPTIVARQGGGWEADGRVEFEEFATTTGITFEGESDEVDTIGGLVVALAGRVPQRGEILSHPFGYDFEILEADARKVRKVRIRRTPAPADIQAQAQE
jgi:CBS domain containing-hemolysin-like protein